MSGKSVYYCEGMKLFGESIVKHYGYKRYDPTTDIDAPTLFEGLYFQQCYDAFKNHKGERTVYWNGSDVYRAMTNPSWQKILKETPATHLCGSAAYIPELASIGVKATHHPLLFGDITSYELSYKHSENPQVYMTAHPGREREYGVPLAIQVAKETGVRFHIYGLEGESTGEIIFHGFIDPTIMDKEIQEFQGAVKFIARDGISQTVAKSCLLAQYPMSVNKIEKVWHTPTKNELVAYLNKLKDQKEPNIELRNHYLEVFGKGI